MNLKLKIKNLKLGRGFTPHLLWNSPQPTEPGQEPRRSTEGAGFTLFELVIGITLLTLAVLLIGSFGLDIFESQITFGSALGIQQEVQQTIKTILPELRSARTSDNGSYPIFVAASNSLIFYSDANGDGSTEQIRYFLENETLKRGEISPVGTPAVYDPSKEKMEEMVHLVPDEAPAIFEYFNLGYTGTEQPIAQPINVSEIRHIKVNINVDPGIVGSSLFNFSAQVTLRNLR